MKKTIWLFAVLALLACKNKKEGENKVEAKKTDSIDTTPADDKALIDPGTFDFTKPVDVSRISSSIMFFYETEFQFLVYPYADKIIPYAQAYSSPDQGDLSLDFSLKEGMEKQLEKNTPVVVKGKIEGTLYGRLNIIEAEIVSEGKTPAVATFDLQQHKAEHVYNARQLYDMLVKWEDKVVTVTGLYQGFTQSTALDQRVLERRIDMGPDGRNVIGCAFNSDPGVGDQLSAGVDQVTIKGTISQALSYGRPYMQNCELVK